MFESILERKLSKVSGDKKDVPISRSGQRNKSPCLVDRSAKMKFNHRKKYKEISPDRKEALLLNRCMKEIDSRKRLLESRTLDDSVKSTSLSNSTLQRESALIIRDFSLTSNQGSISGTSNDRCGVGSENVANRGSYHYQIQAYLVPLPSADHSGSGGSEESLDLMRVEANSRGKGITN
ncbi:uncharacterized protein LOC107809982 isoform X2 [Nicotiana tabacum]|uniref:Uncharacterized protein LOC107809982 isoform X2 n=3 Tax=Nicotiana tabacum TaxID=4097 RepID=A0AC58UK33_TOBAC